MHNKNSDVLIHRVDTWPVIVPGHNTSFQSRRTRLGIVHVLRASDRQLWRLNPCLPDAKAKFWNSSSWILHFRSSLTKAWPKSIPSLHVTVQEIWQRPSRGKCWSGMVNSQETYCTFRLWYHTHTNVTLQGFSTNSQLHILRVLCWKKKRRNDGREA